jgi:hypothetical protein
MMDDFKERLLDAAAFRFLGRLLIDADQSGLSKLDRAKAYIKEHNCPNPGVLERWLTRKP